MKIEKFKPTEDRLLVRLVKEDATTKGGIIIPDSFEQDTLQGFVVERGPGLREENYEYGVHKDDKILFEKHNMRKIEFEEAPEPLEYVLIKETDVIAII